MAKEIVISADKSNGTTRIALVENGELAELHVETPQHERTLGDIALGRVKKVMPSIRAAFVDIGQQQDAFLHYSDLTDNLPQLLAFVAQDKPEIASIRIKRHVRVARMKRAHIRQKPRRKGKKKSIEDALDALFHARRRARPPKPHATGSKSKLPAIATTDRPEECLQRDQRILVKIVKEPISSKGSRVSTDISLAGRFLVLVPLADYVAVSKKISSYKERRRLRALARSLVPDGFGVIIRTQAEGKKARDLDTDLRLLVEKWRKIEAKLQGKPRPPLTLHEDVNLVSSVIRDLFSDDYDRIIIDDQKIHRNVKGYVQAVAPSMADAVQLYTGNRPVFESTGLHNAVRTAFESRVNLPSGGYLFFERTEAMHVVDVNSGRSGKGLTQEENSLRVNIEAARAIARQMRLRDLGGIICVDFIDMRDEKNRRKVYDELRKEFKRDRAVTKLLPMSDFGVLQITRQRLRPALTTLHTVEEVAGDGGGAEQPPSAEEMPRTALPPVEVAAEGSARRERSGAPRERRREAPEELVARMGQFVADFKAQGGRGALTLRVHPFLCAFLNRRVPNWPTRWSFRHLVRIRVEEDASMSPFDFTFTPQEAGVAAPSAPARRETPAAETPPAPKASERSASAGRGPSPRPARPTPADEPTAKTSSETTTASQSDSPSEGEAPKRQRSRGGRKRGDEQGRERKGGERKGGERQNSGRAHTPARRSVPSEEAAAEGQSPRKPTRERPQAGPQDPEAPQAADANAEEAKPRRRRRRGGRNRRRGGSGGGEQGKSENPSVAQTES